MNHAVNIVLAANFFNGCAVTDVGYFKSGAKKVFIVPTNKRIKDNYIAVLRAKQSQRVRADIASTTSHQYSHEIPSTEMKYWIMRCSPSLNEIVGSQTSKS